jgi:hypothetical protein
MIEHQKTCQNPEYERSDSMRWYKKRRYVFRFSSVSCTFLAVIFDSAIFRRRK